MREPCHILPPRDLSRDFLFITTHLSRRYCHQVERLNASQQEDRDDLLARQYTELEDHEMDIWLELSPQGIHLQGVPKTYPTINVYVEGSRVTFIGKLIKNCRIEY